MCELVSEAHADFIKTSTGFSTGGATREDVALLRRYVAPEVRVKAAGGIKKSRRCRRLYPSRRRPPRNEPHSPRRQVGKKELIKFDQALKR